MSPGWDALIDGDYNYVFPLPHRKKYGLPYIYTPVFLQKLGLFSYEYKSPRRLEEFIGFIPDRYILTDLRISGEPQNIKGKIVSRDNFELPLINSYDLLINGYTSDCRRNIKLAETDNLAFSGEIPAKEAVDHFAERTGKGIIGIKKRSYNSLISLMDYAVINGYGEIRGACIASQLIYVILILKYRKKIILLLTSTSGESRKRRIGYYFVDSIIKQYAGSDMILDFAGSSIPSVASFNSSFGAVNSPFSRLFYSKLPWPFSRRKE
ncbi:MAG: hypothetical protein K8R35_04255 [Bacteroidales bacterium]|nr:hypothetical protein [Bacteroidales bacterium]